MATAAPSDRTPGRRPRVTPAIEGGVVLLAVGIAVGSYFVLTSERLVGRLVPPALLASLLVANIVPGVVVLTLIGRRIARARAAASPIGGRGLLHVRLVVLFSTLAAVPMILVTIFASLLYQYGIGSSDRARAMLANASSLVHENYQAEVSRVVDETRAMSGDVADDLREFPSDSLEFRRRFFIQTYRRNLSEAIILRRGDANPIAVLSPYGKPLRDVVTPAMMDRIDRDGSPIAVEPPGRIGTLVPLGAGARTYLYAARIFDTPLVSQLRRGNAILADYDALQSRSRRLQLRFNGALLFASLLLVGIAVWVALTVADRLVRPVGELVAAARRVESGDLAARVPDRRSRDEVGTLAQAFNQMTSRLERQTADLTSANATLETRRALIEAVMAGVSAGVVAIAADGTVRIANASAARLIGGGDLAGRPLADVAPELAALVAEDAREAIVEIRGGERTLAARIARTDAGPILTFDDITQQVLDQRRAAWADVARRIAHEIKNPLTPIQLAAERLQRRYGGQVDPGDTTFARLTDTIVRQVGDLRRMVDEFSSFARMPKPVFRPEPLLDTLRQVAFLHEVAHPAIAFTLDHADPAPVMVCDRRQISQALTNLVKNAVEAVEAKGDGGNVALSLAADAGRVTIGVADTGVGLPAERERIVEPYMTTRARGTGLGLAIVKKIVEEHHGTIAFADRPGGGSVVTLCFDAAALAAEVQGDDASAPPAISNRPTIRT